MSEESLALLIADCQRAIEDEIVAVRAALARRHLDRPVRAAGARVDRGAETSFAYRFHSLDRRIGPRADDRVRVMTARREALGVVTRVDRRTGAITVRTSDWLGDRVSDAELEFDPTWLLRELSDRLEELATRPDRFHPDTALRLLGRLPPGIGETDLPGHRLRPGLTGSPPDLAMSSMSGDRLATADDLAGWFELNPPQKHALARVLGSDVQLVWGPPGTGKTRLVGAAALALTATGRVLVTAATNAAVDEAARRLGRHMQPDALAAGRMVRVGGAGDAYSLEAAVERRIAGGAGGVLRGLEKLEGHLSISPARNGWDAIEQGAMTQPVRARIARALEAARRREDTDAARRAGQLAARLGRQLVEALDAADIVVTTLSRLATREELRALRYGSVIVDEASAAPLPAILYVASLARERAIAVGDFRQLPAVVVSDTQTSRRWFARDVFRESQVVGDAVELPAPTDRMCAMLDVQYRMAPPIREVVSELFYGGRLEDGRPILEREPAPDAVRFLDTTHLEPVAERVGGSRRNDTHAEVVLEWIERLADEAPGRTIGVVSPYRAQTRLIAERVKARLGRAAPAGLEVATIHRFQGRETSVLLLDTVDAPPGRSWFLDERRNPAFPRLLNVALSRAQDALVVVGTASGLRSVLPEDALLLRLLARLEQAGRRVMLHPDGDSRLGDMVIGQEIIDFE